MKIFQIIKKAIKKLIKKQKQPLDPGVYWQTRRELNYYKEVRRLVRKYAAHANSVLDVGSKDTPIVIDFDWIPKKTTIDLKHKPSFPDVESIKGDFMKIDLDRKFDLVLCLQVLEHTETPEKFMQKLLETGEVAVISVPYKWPKGRCEWHIQDPIDEEKMLKWTNNRRWTEQVIVEDEKVKRMIVVFNGVN